MKKFLKECWDTFKQIQEIRAKAILNGHHWY